MVISINESTNFYKKYTKLESQNLQILANPHVPGVCWVVANDVFVYMFNFDVSSIKYEVNVGNNVVTFDETIDNEPLQFVNILKEFIQELSNE